MCEGERIAREMNTHLNNIRCSMQRNDLPAMLTAAVRFNTCPNCIPGFLRTHVPHEMLQRNFALGYLGLRPSVTRSQVFTVPQCEVNPAILSRIKDSISLFIDSHRMGTFSFMGMRQTPFGQHNMSISTTENGEGPIFLVNVQNWIDRLYQFLLSDQSVIQPFVQAITVSGYLPLHIERFLSSPLTKVHVSILPNTLSSKLSISITVIPDSMDQFKSGLVDSHLACGYQGSITSSLRLPPVDTINNIPLIVSWTITIQLPLLQVVSYMYKAVIVTCPKLLLIGF